MFQDKEVKYIETCCTECNEGYIKGEWFEFMDKHLDSLIEYSDKETDSKKKAEINQQIVNDIKLFSEEGKWICPECHGDYQWDVPV